MAALGRRASSMVGGNLSAGEVFTVLARLHERSSKLDAEEARAKADRERLDASERQALVARLVQLGVELPATAWAKTLEDDGTPVKALTPCARLSSEPLADLRARVTTLAAARGQALNVTASSAPKPPASHGEGGKTFNTKLGPVTLSARELAICTEEGADPEIYAGNLAFQSKYERKA